MIQMPLHRPKLRTALNLRHCFGVDAIGDEGRTDAVNGDVAREALAPVFADLNKYTATMHFVGQSTILTLTGNRATGEAYILAHHLTIDGGKRRLMIAALRYSDQFVKIDGAWLFSERRLYVDWLEERAHFHDTG